MIYMGSSYSLVCDLKSSTMKKFEMTDLGVLHYFLGLEVKQEQDGTFYHKGSMPRIFSKDLTFLTAKQWLLL